MLARQAMPRAARERRIVVRRAHWCALHLFSNGARSPPLAWKPLAALAGTDALRVQSPITGTDACTLPGDTALPPPKPGSRSLRCHLEPWSVCPTLLRNVLCLCLDGRGTADPPRQVTGSRGGKETGRPEGLLVAVLSPWHRPMGSYLLLWLPGALMQKVRLQAPSEQTRTRRECAVRQIRDVEIQSTMLPLELGFCT